MGRTDSNFGHSLKVEDRGLDLDQIFLILRLFRLLDLGLKFAREESANI
jgi:hypothetical protein